MSIRRTCWDDHFLCVHTRRNDGKCWMLMQFDPEFVRSVLLSFALPVRNVWLIKIFQFPFFLKFCFFFCSAAAAAVCSLFYRCATDKNAFHSCSWDSSRERVIALFQINTFHAIYLLTWMVFFVKQILDMLLYIVYFLLYVSFFVGLFLFAVVEAIIFGHLFVSNRDSSDTYDEISYNKLNQSSFLCVKRFCHVNLLCFS